MSICIKKGTRLDADHTKELSQENVENKNESYEDVVDR
jgi:hypothetical protein